MQNKVTVSIADQKFTLVAQENASYVRKVANLVDSKMKENMDGGHVSLLNAAILAAMNIADDYYKGIQGSENLRRQLREYLDESARLQMEVNELKRELSDLKKKTAQGQGK